MIVTGRRPWTMAGCIEHPAVRWRIVFGTDGRASGTRAQIDRMHCIVDVPGPRPHAPGRVSLQSQRNRCATVSNTKPRGRTVFECARTVVLHCVRCRIAELPNRDRFGWLVRRCADAETASETSGDGRRRRRHASVTRVRRAGAGAGTCGGLSERFTPSRVPGDKAR